ncbi:TPA: phage head morphogenesis protein, partial [Escherichia coli]|nr:phage head morphogenesis protein [Escherichia coli]
GWSYNPGSAAFGTDQALIRKLVEIRDAQLREQVVQTLNNSRERQLAFSLWLKRLAGSRQTGHEIRALGFMTESVAEAVHQRTGNMPARLLVMNGKSLATTADAALKPEDLQHLPSLMAKPQAVLWDRENHQLLYVVATRDGMARIEVRTSQTVGRQNDRADVLVSVSRVSAQSLEAAIADGMIDILEGHVEVNK